MATLDQIAEALKRADAAGDAAGATKLALAYRQMQQQSPQQGIIPDWKPGTPPTPDQVQQLADQYGKTVNGQQPPGQVRSAVSPMDATLATVNGLTGSVPGLQQASDAILAGGQSVGDMATGQPVDFGARYNAIQDQRSAVADKAPLANTLGGLGGTVAGTGILAAVPVGAEALGITGSVGKQLLNSMGSSTLYEGAQGLAHGHTGPQLLADEGLGAGSGLLGSTAGQTLKAGGQAIANSVTKGAQNSLINGAVEGSNLTARDVKNAGQAMFQTAFPEGNIPMVHDNSVMKLVSGIQDSLKKFRPNAANDPQAVGLLQHLMSLADSANTPGTAVDLQDLHLASQLADKVAKSPQGRDGAIGTIVGHKIDDFIKQLKPADILGGANPTQNANALMQGISTWAKAKKADILEEAIDKAKGYVSGYDSGLRHTFNGIIRDRDTFSRFTPAEQAAITQVAKGTSGRNVAAIFGKLGFNWNGGHGVGNIVSGGLGTGAVAAAISPFVGPAAPFIAPAITTPVGMVGRNVAAAMADKSAGRALQAVAVGGIPTAAKAPNLLAPPAVGASIAARSVLPSLLGAGVNGIRSQFGG